MDLKNIDLANEEYILTRYQNILKKQDILTVWDLLFNFPTKYDDYSVKSIKDVAIDETVVLEGTVISKISSSYLKSNLTSISFVLDVEGNKIRCVIFNRIFLAKKLTIGKVLKVQGKFYQNYNSFTVSNLIICDEINRNIVPSYKIKDVAHDKLLEIIDKVYRRYKNSIKETLPLDIIQKRNLLSLQDAIGKIHLADSIEEIDKAMYRIKYEELLIYELSTKYLHYQRINNNNCPIIEYDKQILNDFINKLPYELTIDQKTSIDEILNDIHSPYQMNRLLQGEVGSGKTIVACIAVLACITASYQAVLMCPTEILACQHFENIKTVFKDYPNINIELLTGSTSITKKETIINDLKNSKINLLIGTHAVFQEDVEYYNLGLVVADEEHRFGVKQRVMIKNKGLLVNYLKMSATPIPRSLATSTFGDTDISIIKTMPSNRKQVITKLVYQKDKKEVMNRILEELKCNHQIYVVTPLIEESENIDTSDAFNAYRNFTNYFKDKARVGLVHGRMKSEEKDEVMNAFYNHDIDILVATSIIEVGVNVKNATTILILGAERFGVATLHQLRGRVMRSGEKPYCYLIADNLNEVAEERLKMVENTTDGFALAEYDLLHRGPGEFFGEKQSGAISFQYANLLKDHDILQLTLEDAEEIINSHKLFEQSDYQLLFDIVEKNYQNKIKNLD